MIAPSKHKRHGSHIPVLRALHKIVKIQHIIEFGAGIFSTPTFLDKRFFPHLQRLDTYEEKRGWHDSVQAQFAGDKRFHISLIGREKAGFAELAAFASHRMVDLVFVDSSDSHRKYIMEDLHQLGRIIILHDFDMYRRRIKIRKSTHSYVFQPPYKKNSTLVVSDSIPVQELSHLVKWENDFERWVRKEK